MTTPELVAFLINVGLVAVIVQVLKTQVMPILRERYDWVLPILAQLAGPVMAFVSAWFTTKLGLPVDFSPIAGVFAGSTAAALFKPIRAVATTLFQKGRKA